MTRALLQGLYWTSVLAVLYAYFGYPAVLRALALVRRRPVRRAPVTPPLTLIITAYNEERQIECKLLNTLEQDYPREHLQIIVASDCSTDATEDIVRRYAERGVELVRAPERRGKEFAQQCALVHARGEVVAFSDVATHLEPDALRLIVRSFADPSVGCVSSEDRIIDDSGKPSGEGFYVRYEMGLRRLESLVGSVVGLSGSFFAARRSVCEDWQPDIQSDFNTLLNSVRRGWRGVSDPEALGFYRNVRSEAQEFPRKVRTVLRGLSAFSRNLDLLNPSRYGLFSLEFFSHKLCRWLVPFSMLVALLANLCLLDRALYQVLLALAAGFYALAFGGLAFNGLARHKLLRLPAYLLITNVSILVAWKSFMAGKRITAWQPSER